MSKTDSGDELTVKAGYEAWAEHYDSVENPTRDLDAFIIQKMLKEVSAEAVLEIGCGTGKNTGFLLDRFGQVTALDFSAAMLEQARAKPALAAADFIQHDIQQPWPLEAECVDLVTCNLVLEHIEDLLPIYTEAARVLRPGSHFFLCEIHPYRQLAGAQARFSETGSEISVPIQVYRHETSEYVNLALEAGFDLRHLGEWSKAGRDAPYLISLLCALPA